MPPKATQNKQGPHGRRRPTAHHRTVDEGGNLIKTKVIHPKNAPRKTYIIGTPTPHEKHTSQPNEPQVTPPARAQEIERQAYTVVPQKMTPDGRLITRNPDQRTLYSELQIALLKEEYNEDNTRPNPKRLQMLAETLNQMSDAVNNIEPKNVKIWFQNRSCRERQKARQAKATSKQGARSFSSQTYFSNEPLIEEEPGNKRQRPQVFFSRPWEKCTSDSSSSDGYSSDSSDDSNVSEKSRTDSILFGSYSG